MEAQTAHPPSSPSSAAAYPRLVMLQRYCHCTNGVGNSSCSTADAETKTLAAARTSTGHTIQVSLRLAVAEPLSASTVCIQVPDGIGVDASNCKVLAAHGDSVLIVVPVREENHEYYSKKKTDHFVYSAEDPAADPPRPPSLSLLPPLYQHPTEEEEEEEGPVLPELSAFAVGLVRRGEDELVVAGLRAGCSVEDVLELKVAELCLFRSGQWSVRRLPVSSGDADAGEVWDDLSSMWDNTVLTLTVGDRQLCWVDFSRDIMAICDDVFHESHRLRYLRLPMDPCLGTLSNRSVCTTASGSALKFVNILPRCCCGGAGTTNCERSRHAYTVHTWMLRMDGDMEWVKDGMVDATELWALEAYKDLPRFRIECPVVSMYEPNVIYFQLCEPDQFKIGDDTVWLLKVDMRSKTLQPFNEDGLPYTLHMLIPSDVSHFFDSYPNNASDHGELTEQRQMGIEKPLVVIVDEQPVSEGYSNNPMLQPSSLTESSDQASKIFEALLQISRYGLYGDELKAYRILIQDNGRRFRSLLRLPDSMRKDWLLMEIKGI